jgi:hypothetical protein
LEHMQLIYFPFPHTSNFFISAYYCAMWVFPLKVSLSGDTGDFTQGLSLAGQGLYHCSHAPSPFSLLHLHSIPL